MAVDRIGAAYGLLFYSHSPTAHHDFCDPSVLTFVRSGLKLQRESRLQL
jgi:hypothetical protein